MEGFSDLSKSYLQIWVIHYGQIGVNWEQVGGMKMEMMVLIIIILAYTYIICIMFQALFWVKPHLIFFFFFHFSFIIHMSIQGLVHFSPLPPPPPSFNLYNSPLRNILWLYYSTRERLNYLSKVIHNDNALKKFSMWGRGEILLWKVAERFGGGFVLTFIGKPLAFIM
jgi:hypothetical protein